MENQSATINYSKDNVVIYVSISCNVFEVVATNMNIQTTYTNTFDLGKNIDYNAVYNFIVSKQATIKFEKNITKIECGFIKL